MTLDAQLQDKIGQLSNLPTLPQVASRLMSAVRDQGISAGGVAALIGQDLSLSAKVLRLANSAFYGIPRTITNITNAVVILGMKVVTTMVLSLTVFDMFPGEKGSKLFDRKAFWLHSLACGFLGKLLAGRVRNSSMIDAEEVFCSGLLHDVGKVVMEQYLHRDFHTALQLAKDRGIPVLQAEREALGYTHTDVAEWLTARWELPLELHLPLMFHHEPDRAGQFYAPTALCHVADVLSYQASFAPGSWVSPPILDPQCMARLRITQQDLDDVRAAFEADIDKLDIFYRTAARR